MDDAAYSLFVSILFCMMLKKTHKNTKEEATAGFDNMDAYLLVY